MVGHDAELAFIRKIDPSVPRPDPSPEQLAAEAPDNKRPSPAGADCAGNRRRDRPASKIDPPLSIDNARASNQKKSYSQKLNTTSYQHMLVLLFESN